MVTSYAAAGILLASVMDDGDSGVAVAHVCSVMYTGGSLSRLLSVLAATDHCTLSPSYGEVRTTDYSRHYGGSEILPS